MSRYALLAWLSIKHKPPEDLVSLNSFLTMCLFLGSASAMFLGADERLDLYICTRKLVMSFNPLPSNISSKFNFTRVSLQ